MGLTVKGVAKLTAPGRHGDGHGLYLQVLSPTNRSWLFRYQRSGRERWLGLGPVHTVTLVEARERARQARLQLLDGVDPLDAKQVDRSNRALAKAKALTFEQAAVAYFNQHEKRWTNRKHRDQFLSSMRNYVYPVIGNIAIGDVDTGLVLRCLEPIWATKTETASRVRGRIENVLGWATVRGYRTGDNPARWKGHLGEVLPARSAINKTAHHPALPYAEMPAFMAALRARDGVSARALEYTILTAGRTAEVIGATWDELQGEVWTVPAHRMKGSKEHRVPLSDRARAILDGLPTERSSRHIFIGAHKGTGLAHTAMPAALRRMGRSDVTVPGFRSTFRDWAAECTATPNHVVEMALAHVIGNKVEAAYRRGDLFDKRRQLMAEWSQFCMGVLS